MATIEERAEAFNASEDWKKGYCQGASEQQALDYESFSINRRYIIERACTWLNDNYWSEASQKQFVEDFRKYMEEE